MSWVTIVWAMVGSACLMLAAVHLPVWVKDRAAWPSLFLSVLAGATAAVAFCELAIMKAQAPEAFAAANRAGQVAVWLATVSLAVPFDRLGSRLICAAMDLAQRRRKRTPTPVEATDS